MLKMGPLTLEGLVSTLGNGTRMLRRSSVPRAYSDAVPPSLSSCEINCFQNGTQSAFFRPILHVGGECNAALFETVIITNYSLFGANDKY